MHKSAFFECEKKSEHMVSLASFLEKEFQLDFPNYFLKVEVKDFEGKEYLQDDTIWIKFFHQVSHYSQKTIFTIKFVVFTPVFPIERPAKSWWSSWLHIKPKRCVHYVTTKWKFYPNHTIMRLQNYTLPFLTQLFLELNFFPTDLSKMVLNYIQSDTTCDLPLNIMSFCRQENTWTLEGNTDLVPKCIDRLLDQFFELLVINEKDGKATRSIFSQEFMWDYHLIEKPSFCPLHSSLETRYFHGIQNDTPLFLIFWGLMARADPLIKIKVEHFPSTIYESTYFDRYLIKRIRKGTLPCKLYFCFEDVHWG